jgi:hypothetical protein
MAIEERRAISCSRKIKNQNKTPSRSRMQVGVIFLLPATPSHTIGMGNAVKVFTSVQDQRPALEHHRFQKGAAGEWLHAGPWRWRC